MLVIENGMFVKLYFKNYQKRYRDRGKRGERERDGWVEGKPKGWEKRFNRKNNCFIMRTILITSKRYFNALFSRVTHKYNILFTMYRSSLSTYKELCAIANDLNQPDLIYKFMHLANHNAMWNSRRVFTCLCL